MGDAAAWPRGLRIERWIRRDPDVVAADPRHPPISQVEHCRVRADRPPVGGRQCVGRFGCVVGHAARVSPAVARREKAPAAPHPGRTHGLGRSSAGVAASRRALLASPMCSARSPPSVTGCRDQESPRSAARRVRVVAVATLVPPPAILSLDPDAGRHSVRLMVGLRQPSRMIDRVRLKPESPRGRFSLTLQRCTASPPARRSRR